MKKILLAMVCLSLAGCTHSISLMSQNNGTMGRGTANEIGKTVTIELNGETYNGNYAYLKDGMVGFGHSFVQGSVTAGGSYATGNAVANSTYFTEAAAGNGTVMASSASGKGLRCQFSYSTASHSGAGICRDDAKNLYDLQID